MLEIVFSVCLLAAPFQCETVRMETEFKDTEFLQCITKAEQYIAQYVTADKYIKYIECSRKSKDI